MAAAVQYRSGPAGPGTPRPALRARGIWQLARPVVARQSLTLEPRVAAFLACPYLGRHHCELRAARNPPRSGRRSPADRSGQRRPTRPSIRRPYSERMESFGCPEGAEPLAGPSGVGRSCLPEPPRRIGRRPPDVGVLGGWCCSQRRLACESPRTAPVDSGKRRHCQESRHDVFGLCLNPASPEASSPVRPGLVQQESCDGFASHNSPGSAASFFSAARTQSQRPKTIAHSKRMIETRTLRLRATEKLLGMNRVQRESTAAAAKPKRKPPAVSHGIESPSFSLRMTGPGIEQKIGR